MRQLGNGLSAAKHYEDALSVQEAELSMCGALAHQKNEFSSCRPIFRTRMLRWEGLDRPCRWIKTYTADV